MSIPIWKSPMYFGEDFIAAAVIKVSECEMFNLVSVPSLNFPWGFPFESYSISNDSDFVPKIFESNCFVNDIPA